jgi:hypothetical protein
MKKRNRLLRLVAGIAVFAAASLALAPAAGAHDMNDMRDMQTSRGSVIDLVRAAFATAPFLSPELASRAGYSVVVADKQGITCIADTAVPSAGTMGEHHLNPTLIDLAADPNVQDTVEVTKPELVVYEPDGSGHLRLVALEYLILKDEWDAAHSGPPALFGQNFMETGADNRFGLPAYYSLHVWIWKFNPSGLFSMWNPNVHCPVA